ncbi:Prohibitin-3, mitochondrial [Capsicum annuum]|uniref:Prohibitin n=1 Tax=Capsicum annuum TaxID=4072 RepID=A0A2G2YKL1_CAPAN|nr:Prohibitin-3, mitochondrial [Capsicum annuum]
MSPILHSRLKRHLSFNFLKIHPSFENKDLKYVMAQFNTYQLLSEHPQVSPLVCEILIHHSKNFNIKLDDEVAQQEGERSKIVVMKAEQERRVIIILVEEESESTKLICDAIAATGMVLIEFRILRLLGRMLSL